MNVKVIQASLKCLPGGKCEFLILGERLLTSLSAQQT